MDTQKKPRLENELKMDRFNKQKNNNTKCTKTYKIYVQEIVYIQIVYKRRSDTEQTSKRLTVQVNVKSTSVE